MNSTKTFRNLRNFGEIFGRWEMGNDCDRGADLFLFTACLIMLYTSYSNVSDISWLSFVHKFVQSVPTWAVFMALCMALCTFQSHPAGISKGVGFIRFDRRYEAEKAIEKLNGTIPPNSAEKITVKFANTPNSKGAATAIPMALAAASYLSPVRQVLGPIHHAAGRFRYATATCCYLSI